MYLLAAVGKTIIEMMHLCCYRWGTTRWHSTASHSHVSTWACGSLLLSGSSGDDLQCCLPPVQLCVQKQKVITKLVHVRQ